MRGPEPQRRNRRYRAFGAAATKPAADRAPGGPQLIGGTHDYLR